MHAKVQREIGEHDETGCEAKAANRHLVAENARIYHLTASPVATQHRTTRLLWSGRANVNSSMSASAQQRPVRLPWQSLPVTPPIKRTISEPPWISQKGQQEVRASQMVAVIRGV